jgi:hypothetical protein
MTMSHRRNPLFRPVPGVAFALVLGSAPAPAIETGVYQAPALGTKFLLIGGEDADGDGDGTRETRIVHYQDAAGDKIFSMTTKGRLWAWSLKMQGSDGADAGEGGWNYVIRDSDCDGVFDERYRLDEEFHVPDCLK